MQRLISRLPRSDEEVADIEQGKIKEARAEIRSPLGCI